MVFIVAFVALAVGLFGAGPASAATASAAQTRVGASTSAGQVTVGPSAGITACQRIGNSPVQHQIVVATGVAAEAGASAVESGAARTPTTAEQRSVNSLRKQISSHVEKLDAYRANPDTPDNLAILEREPTPEIVQRIIDGRIRDLKTEIRTFQYQVDKLLRGGQ